jgi:hypothetical protein
MCIFIGGTSHLQRREGGNFYTCHPKTSCWELASRNQNIQNLKYSRYKKNWTLRFGKLECLIFSSSTICSVWGHYISLISLKFLCYVSIETLLVIHVVSLLIERQHILKIKYKINSFNLSLY